MKKILLFSAYLLFTLCLSAQVLINKTMEVATGHPNTLYEYHAMTQDASGNWYLTGNTVEPLQREVFFIAKFNYDGLEWMNVYDTTMTGWRVFATDLTTHGSDLYVTGTAVDTNRIHSTYITGKFDSAGNIKWVQYFENPFYIGLNVATSVRMVQDPVTGIYHLLVTGSGQTGVADAGIVTVGYVDSTLVDFAYYDSTGLFDVPALVTIDSENVYITGASGSTFGSWDFLTLAYKIHGALIPPRAQPTATGAMHR